MAEIPGSIPPMGAEFEKPYMEFEYDGRVYRLEALKGGHNPKKQDDPQNPTDPAVQACIASPPSYDSVRERWVVHVDNNLVHINMADQSQRTLSSLEPDSPIRQAVIEPHPDRRSTGLLISATSDPGAQPEFPVDCEFEIFLRVAAPGLPSLANRDALRLTATALEQWPPPVGTEYANPNGVAFFLEGDDEGDQPVMRILPGDTTVLTNVYTVQ